MVDRLWSDVRCAGEEGSVTGSSLERKRVVELKKQHHMLYVDVEQMAFDPLKRPIKQCTEIQQRKMQPYQGLNAVFYVDFNEHTTTMRGSLDPFSISLSLCSPHL